MTVVEGPEPGCRSELQGSMLAGLRFQAPASEIVRTRRNHHTWGDFEGGEEGLGVWVPVEFKTVARFEADVKRCHKILPRFHNPPRVRVAGVLVLKEFLQYPSERAIFRRAWWVIATNGQVSQSGVG